MPRYSECHLACPTYMLDMVWSNRLGWVLEKLLSLSWTGFLCDTPWLTPPARQAVALPAGRLAAVGVNTVASLQAARTKRAHLHMWTEAKEEKSRQGWSDSRTHPEKTAPPPTWDNKGSSLHAERGRHTWSRSFTVNPICLLNRHNIS